MSRESRAKLGLGIGALVVGVSLGALNFVFLPRLDLFVPIWGLGLKLAIAAVLGFLPAALALVLARRREVPRLVLTALWVLLGLGPGTLLGAWWLDARREAALESAVQHCDAVRGQIESFQRARGRLPRSLDELPGSTQRPLLVLTGDVTYHATAEHFEFRINTSRGLGFHGPIFDSRTGSWTR